MAVSLAGLCESTAIRGRTWSSTSKPKALKAVTLLRQFLPELMAMTLPAVHRLVKGCLSYRTREAYGNIEAHRLRRKAEGLGFQVAAEVITKVTYLPMRDNHVVEVIEDEELAVEVARRMIEAGVPVVEVHPD